MQRQKQHMDGRAPRVALSVGILPLVTALGQKWPRKAVASLAGPQLSSI